MHRLATPAALAAVGLLIGLPAFAQSHPQTASPPVSATVTPVPSEVTLAFTQVVEPSVAGIGVVGSNAQHLDKGQPHLADGDGKRRALGRQSLPPGVYTVAWAATPVDSHRTGGSSPVTMAAADASGISLEHVWARASAGAATTGAAYLTVTDNGRPDRLVGASTPIAGMAELHETINDNGVMKMRSVAGIALEQGKPVTFAPGGYHIMLMGLKSPLKAGDSFPLTLTFEHARPITVTAHVEAMGGAGMDHGSMGGMGMSGQGGSTPGMSGQMGSHMGSKP